MDKQQTKAFIEQVEGKMLAVASEEVADRDGDVLTLKGWDLKNYKKNPVLMWLHMMDGSTMPIGNAKNIRFEKVGGVEKLVFEPDFHEITEEAKTIKQMYEQGYLKAFSVGFQPKEWEVISESGEFPPRYKYTKQELIEISAVPIPALPSALIMNSAKKAKMNLKEVKSILEQFEHAKGKAVTVKQDDPDEAKPDEEVKPEESTVTEPVAPEAPADTPEDAKPEDTEKAVTKRGRVLSSKNESKIKQAVGILQEVLSALGQNEDGDPDEEEEEDETKKYVTVEAFKKHIDRVTHLISEVQKDRQERKEKASETDEEKVNKLLASIIEQAVAKAQSKLNPSGESSHEEVK